VFHDLRHTAITHDAAAVMFPGAADKTEKRLFGAGEIRRQVES
jgi:hypothetical protein